MTIAVKSVPVKTKRLNRIILNSSFVDEKKEYEQFKEAFLNTSKSSMAQQINKYL